MNRHDRRRARALKVGEMVSIDWGRCLSGDESEVTCFACGGEAEDWPWPEGLALFGLPEGSVLLGYGIALINRRGKTMPVPICETCFGDDTTSGHAIMREICGDMEFVDGGVATPEQVAKIANALTEKQSAVEH
jgi:hypothetical protein